MDVGGSRQEQKNSTEKLGGGGVVEGRRLEPGHSAGGQTLLLGVAPNLSVPQFLYL